MADIRINALTSTAATTASDDYLAVDGSANGTRKLSAYSPTFGGNLTVSGDVLLPTNSAYRLNGKVALLYNGSNLYIEPNNDLGNIVIGAAAQTTYGFTVGGNLTVSGTTGTIGSNSGFTWNLGSGGSFTALSTGRPTITAAVASGNNAGAALSLLPRGGGSRRTWNLETDTTEAGDCVLRQSTTEAGSTFTNALYFSAARNATLSGNLTVSGTGTSSFASGSKLGVGTTSPGVTFVAVGAPATLNYTIGSTSLADIRSTSAATTNDGPSLTFSGYYQTSLNTSTYGAIKGVLLGAGDGNSAAGALAFLTSNTGGALSEQARLTNLGNFIIGSPFTDAGYKLQVNGYAIIAGLIVSNSATDQKMSFVAAANSTYGGANYLRWYRADGTTTRAFFGFGSGNSQVFNLGTEESGDSLQFSTGTNTTALTLDSSQNATFAGSITSSTFPSLTIAGGNISAQQYISLNTSGNNGVNIANSTTFTSLVNGSAVLAAIPTLNGSGSGVHGVIKVAPTLTAWTNTGTFVGLELSLPAISGTVIGLRSNKQVSVTDTTASTSTTTGALVVSGGVGVAGAVNAGGNLTVTGTGAFGDATGGVFYQASLNSNNQGTGVRLLNNNAGSRNWYIGSQNNVGNAVEITPSTANNGTTFSTPVWQVSSGGNVTQTGNLTVSGTQNVLGLPASASVLSTNSTMTFERTSDTSLKILVRGSDGITRSVALTLA